MNNITQNNVTPVEEEKNSFGEKLRSARENKGLSVQEAAAQLRLSPGVITLLETENWHCANLPFIYLRGYLRAYTRLLNIPAQEAADILATLDPQPAALAPAAMSPDCVSLSFPLQNNPYYARIATFLILAVLLTSITAWWYLHTGIASSPALALKPPAMNNVPEAAAPPAGPVPPDASLALNLVPAETAVQSPEVAQIKQPEAALSTAAQKPMALNTASIAQNTNPIAAQPMPAGPKENDDDNTDEPE